MGFHSKSWHQNRKNCFLDSFHFISFISKLHDTSLFNVVEDSNAAAIDMNHDLKLINQWAHSWRMSFNPDPQKQAVERIFSRKKNEIDHPVVLFNDTPVKKVIEYKHLGIVLDSKLSFNAHVKAAISKTRKGIGMLKFLYRYLPRHTLDQLYKLHVRPYQDYGDVIFHTPAKLCEFSHNEILTNSMEKLESVQNSAAMGVTGAWKGTSRANLYAELGWESLNLRRWSRRLALLYKIVNSLTPSYMAEPIPPLQQSHYTLRNQGKNRKIQVYPSCLTEWNELDPEIRLAPPVTVFKKKLLSIIRPPAKSVFGIHDPMGLSHLTQLRVGLRKFNFHKFRHSFKDTVNPMCPTNDGVEDTEHFLLLCPSFAVQRQNLLAEILPLLRPLGYANLSNEVLTQLLLYGDENLPNDVYRNILELTLKFIQETGRLD